MPRKYTQLTFTDSVKQVQTQYGSRANGERVEAWQIDDEHFTQREASFISQRDGFYMASVNVDGWPYVQFRGGPAGFVKILDSQTFAFADFKGNRQYISTGNLMQAQKVALFFMDYAHQQRLKCMARVEIFSAEARPDLVAQMHDADYPATVERVFLFNLVAFDWNCPQHITPRFTEAEFSAHRARQSN